MNLAIGLRNLGRVREILSVLVDYGFGYVFDELGLTHALPLGRRRGIAPEYARIAGPRRLRLALAELGPTFIKLGQMFSARADLLVPAVVTELRALQDSGPEVTYEQIRGTIERELGRPLEQCFDQFEREPLSSASLGQVHGAVLADGREVTVKVLRPGVRRVVEADLQILAEAAYLLQRQVPHLRRYDLPALVRRLSGQIEDEMVYTLEAHNAERMRQSLDASQLRVRAPAVVWNLTAREVLTMERLRGHRVDRLPPVAPGLDRAAAAGDLARCLLRQIFVDGFFHGDPHQGNVLVADDGTALLLDFGIVGYLDPRTRRLLGDMVRRIREEDIDGLVGTLSELGALGAETDLASLRSELARLVGRFVNVSRRHFPVGELMSRVLRVLWLHSIRVPPELALAAKALLMAEGTARDLDPDADLLALSEPVLEEARQELLRPSALLDRALHSLEAAAQHIGRLPARLDRVLALSEQGGLRLRVEDPAAEGRLAGLTRGLNRLALSTLAGALLVGSAVYLSVPRAPFQAGIGLAGVVLAVMLGIVVVLSVLRPGRI